MPGPPFDYKLEPGYNELYSRLLAEMNAEEITDLRPWMTRALEIDHELREQREAGRTEEQ